MTRIYDEIEKPANSLYIRNIIRGYLRVLYRRIDDILKQIPSLKDLDFNNMNVIEDLLKQKKKRDYIITEIKRYKLK